VSILIVESAAESTVTHGRSLFSSPYVCGASSTANRKNPHLYSGSLLLTQSDTVCLRIANRFGTGRFIDRTRVGVYSQTLELPCTSSRGDNAECSIGSFTRTRSGKEHLIDCSTARRESMTEPGAGGTHAFVRNDSREKIHIFTNNGPVIFRIGSYQRGLHQSEIRELGTDVAGARPADDGRRHVRKAGFRCVRSIAR